MFTHNHKPLPLQKIRKNLTCLETSELLDSQPLQTCISKACFLVLQFQSVASKVTFSCFCLWEWESLPLLEFCGTKTPAIIAVSNFSCMRISWYICKLKNLIFRPTIEIFESVVLWQGPGICIFNKYSRQFLGIWYIRCLWETLLKCFPLTSALYCVIWPKLAVRWGEIFIWSYVFLSCKPCCGVNIKDDFWNLVSWSG